MLECTYDNCPKKQYARQLCKGHYEQIRRGAPLSPLRNPLGNISCLVDGCDIKQTSYGLCPSHRRQELSGKEFHQFRVKHGKGWKNKAGYALTYKPDHPNANSGGKILVHVLVMSEHLGCPLQYGEKVHHKNGIRDDNRIENLELWVVSQPAGQRTEDLLAWAYEIIERYGP